MGKYGYRIDYSQDNKFAQYSNMKIFIQEPDYKAHKFVSIFEPKFLNQNNLLNNNQIEYSVLSSILLCACDAKNLLNWTEILKIKNYDAKKPEIIKFLPEPEAPEIPEEPIYYDLDPKLINIGDKPSYYEPNLEFWRSREGSSKIAMFINKLLKYGHKILFNYRLRSWELKNNRYLLAKESSRYFKVYQNSLSKYHEDLANYNFAHTIWINKCEEAKKTLKSALLLWESEKRNFEYNVQIEYKKLKKIKFNYENSDKDGVEEVVKIILSRSPYPNTFPRNFKVNYDKETKILLIDFQLPDFERFEIIEKDKRHNFKNITKTKRKLIISSSLPSVAIRTLYEIVMNDECNKILSVVFNGWVKFIDKTTGTEKSEYILSVHALKQDIDKLIISQIDPMECFKALKGLVANNILEYIPIAPILVLNKNDNRLVEGRKIISGLSPEDNLAAMDWKDFEHLIRELFEKEFSKHGAEVRITRASYDRGVDAIIYDPDPIRGGKFIIQAKRYTKLVDVSAVRDLFGAIQNENANRGILVTTSHYGPEAYEFAKDKNITLLTGEHLLHLLEKHHYKFRIDIKEARKLLNLKN
ncbi:EcoKMrr [Legionella sainthelensi]|uniref:restriction endonuclease n=1 Tax=Legionella sainthelensi TaxID=28087 RepID=UPI000F6C1ABC|nr:restriction endonuclease [Legionella sainthelensi]VEB35404.1 EcoKMrr [Legionella sainthelensi]